MLLYPIKNIRSPKAAEAGESDGGKTTLQGLIDTIEDLYKSLLSNGYKLNEIEEMDIFYLLYLTGEEENKEPKLTPIENVPW